MNENQAIINIQGLNIYHFLVGLLQFIYSKKIHSEQHRTSKNNVTKYLVTL